MTAVLVFERAGLATSLQDLGRFGLQRYGVPVAGALDPLAARLANALVGNDESEAVLEILVLGPRFTVEADSARLALVGSTVGLLVDGATVSAGRSVTVRCGSRVAIGGFTDSACCCLAVAGGFAVEPVMGSRSTYARGGFGGWQGRTLKDGDRLPLRADAAPGRPERRAGAIAYGDGPIRVVPGPQAEEFTAESIERFFAETYTVTAEADRMGLRLAGSALSHRGDFNIASDGIATGAIQVPGTGRPILLLAEHQTIGGYPKLGTVASADLPRLGRLRPGASLRFTPVETAAAEALRRVQEQQFRALLAALAPITATPQTEALLAANLISGVVAAEGEVSS